MFKLLIFFIVAVIIAFYYLKDHNINDLQSMLKNSSSKNKSIHSENDSKETNKSSTGFKKGQCVRTADNKWSFIKLMDKKNGQYFYLNCKKYQGCHSKLLSIEIKSFNNSFTHKDLTSCQE